VKAVLAQGDSMGADREDRGKEWVLGDDSGPLLIWAAADLGRWGAALELHRIGDASPESSPLSNYPGALRNL